MSSPLPASALSASGDPQSFLTAVNTLFETAPPLASYLLKKRPFASYAAVISEADQAIRQSLGERTEQQLQDSEVFSREELLEIINAHPRIGGNVKRNSQQEQQLSAMSRMEQGIDRAHEDADALEIAESLQQLNAEYEAKFGFCFVVFVNGRHRRDIIPVLRQCIDEGTAEGELKRGLVDMLLIAADRLRKTDAGVASGAKTNSAAAISDSSAKSISDTSRSNL